MVEYIRLYDICRNGSRALGPGLRYIIWTQGCSFHCPKCLSPNSRPLDKGYLVKIDSLADDIINHPTIEGITISGGEPMLQAESLCKLVSIMKHKRPELTFICFTGFNREDLTSFSQQQLIDSIDLLIDGPYIDQLNDGKGLRGSSNQRLHFISDRLLSFKDELEQKSRNVEFHIHADKTVAYGIPKKGLFN